MSRISGKVARLAQGYKGKLLTVHTYMNTNLSFVDEMVTRNPEEMPGSYSQLGEPFPFSQGFSTFNDGASEDGNTKDSYDPSYSSERLNKHVVYVHEGIRRI